MQEYVITITRYSEIQLHEYEWEINVIIHVAEADVKRESNWTLVKMYHDEDAGHQKGQDPASGHPHPIQMSQGYSKHPGKEEGGE